MKKIWGRHKKLIMGITAAVLAFAVILSQVIYSGAEAQAANILNSMKTKYAGRTDFTVLEIVPTQENHQYEEIGMFVSSNQDAQEPYRASVSQYINQTFRAELGGSKLDQLLEMRMYGLVKRAGTDMGANDSVSEAPIYQTWNGAVMPAFSEGNAGAEGYSVVDSKFFYTRGIYSYQENGNYKLADGYYIGDDGYIYKSGDIPDPEPTVSDIDEPEPEEPDEPDEPSPDDPIVVSDNSFRVMVAEGTTEEVTITEDGTPADSGESDSNADDGYKPSTDDNSGFSAYTATPWYFNDILPVSANSVQIMPNLSGRFFAYADNGVIGAVRQYAPLPEGVTYVGDGSGNIGFEPSANGYYWGKFNTTIYCCDTNGNVKYYNANWFKALLFGDKNAAINIHINTVAANQVTKTQIESADLVYISGTADAFIRRNCDISADVLQTIYNESVVKHKAVMMDYDVFPNESYLLEYSGMDDSDITAAKASNLGKLAILMWQADQKAVAGLYPSKFDADEDSDNYGAITDIGSVLSDTTLLTDLGNSMVSGATGNFVTGNLYVYDHHMDLFEDAKCMVDANDFFANGDLNSKYTVAACNAGFSNVYAHISNNNASYLDSRVIDGVTPALALQYILSADGAAASLVKSTIHVLEIEPANAFLYNSNNFEHTEFAFCNSTVKKNREEFIEEYVNPEFVTLGKQGYVSFTSKSINEFVCMNENILEKYDMIYIGSYAPGDRYYLRNTNYSWDAVENRTQSIQISTFNDAEMNGMVYYNIGDKMRTDSYSMGMEAAVGWLDADYKSSSYVFARYAGRDLTTDKLKQLESYLDAGHPIIVAGDLMCTNSSGIKTINPTAYSQYISGQILDHGRIDNSSKMYELFKYAASQEEYDYDKGDWKPLMAAQSDPDALYVPSFNNFISARDVGRGLVTIEDISGYLNAPKLYIDISDRPTEYGYETNGPVINPDSIRYLEAAEDGTAYLDYEFTISGVSDRNLNMTYTARLLVDVNADGKFSSDEECDDAIISFAATGSEAPRNDDGDYALEEGVAYHLRRALPENYSGIITWCLRAEVAGDSNIQANEKGYTCVKAAEPEEIRILQITNCPNDSTIFNGNVSTLDLQKQVHGGGNMSAPANKNDVNTTSMFGKYLSKLADHKVYVRTITVSQFQSQYNAWYTSETTKYAGGQRKTQPDPMEFFDNYRIYTDSSNASAGLGANMIILGFGDGIAQVTTQPPIDAIKSFIDSGRATLLCHDFIIFRSIAMQSKQLRNIVGMDRYDIAGEIASLHKGRGDGKYSRTSDRAEVKAAEENPNGKLVAYQPGSNKNVLLRATYGFTDTHLWRHANSYNEKKYSAATVLNATGAYTWEKYVTNCIDQVNEGQLTEYPYHLPKTFNVATTHSQYFTLDLESDSDNDGSADTVVWYTLLTDQGNRASLNALYNVAASDGANQYYIYNKGNVTYTGSGHSDGYTDEEAQLFVNTMLAAYTAVDKAPTVKFYETASSTSNELENIAIPYDSTVTDPMDAFGVRGAVTDSSIQYNPEKNDYDYKFVDPNVDDSVPVADRTAVYFKATDSNFKKGTKRMSLTFYLEVAGQAGDQFVLDNGTTQTVVSKIINGEAINVVEIPIQVYSTDFATKIVSKELWDSDKGISTQESEVQSGKMYGMYLPLAYLKDHGALSIYVEAQTFINNVSTSGAVTAEVNEALGYGKLDITKVDLLKLD